MAIDARPLVPGDRLRQRYELIEHLGQGGLGTTFRALDTATGEQVAVKILRHQAPELVASLRNEFLTLSSLTHPHLLAVYDFGRTQQDERISFFYVSELISGVSLAHFAVGSTWEEVQRPFLHALEALGFLHRTEWIHGDFRPENILVTSRGRGTLIDLSCCGHVGALAPISGTDGFIAPERLDGAPCHPRMDLYAVGACLEFLERAGCALPAPVRSLRVRLLSEDPDRRPANVGEVFELLGQLQTPCWLPTGRAKPFLGRTKLMAAYHEALRALLEDREGPRTLVIKGPDDSGRSRLLAQMKWSTELEADVVEAIVHAPDAITAMLERALDGKPLPKNVVGVLEAWNALTDRRRPVVLFIDDVHHLGRNQRSLLFNLIRTVEHEHRVLIVCTGRADALTTSFPDTARILTLDPLSTQELNIWVGEELSSEAIDLLRELTGGLPGQVDRTLARLPRGEVSVSTLRDLWDRTQRTMDEGGVLSSLAALHERSRRALVALALLGGHARESELRMSGVTTAALAEAHALCERRGAEWRIPRVHLSTLLESTSALELETVASELASSLAHALEDLPKSSPLRSRLSSRLVNLLLELSRVDEAVELFRCNEPLWLRHPDELELIVDRLVARQRAPSVLCVDAAAILERLGRPERALELLEHQAEPQIEPLSAQALLVMASCHLKQGNATAALTSLDAAEALGEESIESRAADLRARLELKRGNYERAKSIALEALEKGPPEGSCSSLHLDIAIAASYLGEVEEGRTHFSRARSLRPQPVDPAELLRAMSYEALHHLRLGEAEIAARDFRATLQLAEDAGLGVPIANAALNLGVAAHQCGDLGTALAAYERGARVAQAIASTSHGVTLTYNLAALYFDIGLERRAQLTAIRAQTQAETAEIYHIAATARILLAEIMLCRERFEEADDLLEQAHSRFEVEGAVRELAEVELLQLHLAWRRDADDVTARFARILDTVRRVDASDLEVRALLLQGRLLSAASKTRAALESLESGLELARKIGLRLFVAEAETVLAQVFSEQGATRLVKAHRDRALELYERMATTLPQDLQKTFWLHPLRNELRRLCPARAEGEWARGSSQEEDRELNEDGEGGDRRDAQRLRRILAINRKLSSALDTKKVLALTMDSAIELTGAERGFLLLKGHRRDRRDGPLEVAVARNIDGEQLLKTHLKFSHGIAQTVLETGEPTVTVDASNDSRYRGNESVHAMRLKSVLCVPVRGPQGVIGALYLDNRFKPGRFREAELDSLLAFADQVAIALENARLHGEVTAKSHELALRARQLEQQSRELDAERSRVQQLAAEQAAQIERLSREIVAHRSTDGYRYDYSAIIGRGPAMSRVLSILERVVDSPVTVLIQGESGTGKELVARTIHSNSSRHHAPFHALNCGALPESLLEAELFGYRRGAFTDARDDREGLFVAAQGGTILLDEVGEMGRPMQVRLLRVLQEREVSPLGGDEVIPVDVRILCATNVDLLAAVRAGKFREDLYYRLAVVELELPPLRERLEDVPELVAFFLERIAKRLGKPVPRASQDLLEALLAHPFPGNVRQLENVLARAILFLDDTVLTADSLELPPLEVSQSAAPARSRAEYAEREEELIKFALQVERWNVSRTARRLGMSRATVYNKMKRYGLNRRPG